MFPIHSVSLLVDWVTQWPCFALLRILSFIVTSIPPLPRLRCCEINEVTRNVDCMESDSYNDEKNIIICCIATQSTSGWIHRVYQDLLSSPSYSTLHTQNIKQNQNEKKVSTYKNLIFWPSAFICLHSCVIMLQIKCSGRKIICPIWSYLPILT